MSARCPVCLTDLRHPDDPCPACAQESEVARLHRADGPGPDPADNIGAPYSDLELDNCRDFEAEREWERSEDFDARERA